MRKGCGFGTTTGHVGPDHPRTLTIRNALVQWRVRVLTGEG
ncbi:hypothetical protein [Streptomyces sp. NPDC088910]